MVASSNWQKINIGDDTTLKARIGWQGLTTSEYKDNGEYYLVTGTDFENGLVNWDTCHFVDKWRFDQDKNIQLKIDDVLITKDGTIGKAGFVETLKLPATLNSGVFVIRSNSEKVEQKYLYYIFTSKIFDEFLNKLTAGSTINHLYQKDFIHFTFNAPQKEEQQAIAIALSDTDELIEQLQKLISKKEDIKTATMQLLLTGKKRLDGFSDEWDTYDFPSVCWFQEGPGVRKYQFTNSGVKLLNGTNIFQGNINLYTTDKYISKEEAYGMYKHFLADENDIVIACSGVSIEKFEEKVAFVKKEHLPFCMNTSTMRFKVSNKLDRNFLYYFLMSSEFKNQIGGKATGSAQLNFGPSHVEKVKIELPSLEEQKIIATILSDIDEELETFKSKLSKTKAIKEGMMSELLTGNTRLI